MQFLKKSNKNKMFFLFVLLWILLIVNFPQQVNDENQKLNKDNDINRDSNNPPQIKRAGYFQLIGQQNIDGESNWTDAIGAGWCQGSGTWDYPYLIENVTFDANFGSYGLNISNSNNFYFKINNCTFKRATISGLYCSNTANGTILNSKFIDNQQYGMTIIQSNNFTIQNNNISDNDKYGLYLGFTHNSTIVNNTIQNNINYGIFNTDSHNNTFKENVIRNHLDVLQGFGLWLSSSNNSRVEHNSFYLHNRSIFVSGDSGFCDNTKITENTCVNTTINIYISTNVRSSLIWANYFYNSSIFNAYDIGSSNLWDNGTIGNYWDNYNGYDENDNGIGDSPYNIEMTGIDNKPIWNDGFNGSQIKIDALSTGVGAHNLTWLSERFYGSGAGTADNPYVLRDLTINANNSGSGIIVNNTRAYLRIENCMVYNTSINSPAINIINASNVFITGCRVLNARGSGISIDPTNNTVISNNVVTNTIGNGIELIDNCFNNSIFNNTIYNNTLSGIYLENSCVNNSIYNNRITNNTYGIRLQGLCINNTLSNNNITLNNAYGISLLDYCNNNSIIGNNISNNGLKTNVNGLYLYNNCGSNNISGNIIANNLGNGINVSWHCYYNLIEKNLIEFNENSGIVIQNSTKSTIILENTITNNTKEGIIIQQGSQYNNLLRNIIENNSQGGIYMFNTILRNNISYNQIKNNEKNGIYFDEICNYNNISNNNIENNGKNGIFMMDGNFNKVSNNTIAFNSKNGIFLNNSSVFNQFWNNSLKYNSQYGLNISDTDSTNNLFYANNFSGNGIKNANSMSLSNNWNTTNIGNYWSDYDGFDLTGDGIGETPYISDNIIDYLPIWTIADNIAPIIIITTPQPYALYAASAPTFNISIEEYKLNATWYFILEINTNRTFTGNGTIDPGLWALVANGTTTIRFYANDSSSNLGYSEVIVRKDIIAPQITINLPINNTYWITAPKINITAIDANLRYVWYNISNQREFLISGIEEDLRSDLWDRPDGWFVIEIYANDSLGNINNTYTLMLFKDNHAPMIIINLPSNNSYYNAQPTIQITATDPNLSYLWYNISNYREFLVSGIAEQLNDTIWNGLGEGMFTIEIYANDSLGQLNNTFTLVFYKDTKNPIVIVNSNNLTIVSTLPSINITGIDINIDELWCVCNGVKEPLTNKSNIPLSNTIWLSLPEGKFEVFLFANDSANNLNDTYVLTFYKDTHSPLLQIINPHNNQIVSNVPIIRVIASDPFFNSTWYVCRGTKVLLTNDTEIGLLSTIWNNIPEGVFTIAFFANDSLGTLNDTFEFTLVKDTLPPIIEIESVEIGEIQDVTEVASVSISWSIEDTTDIQSIKIKIDDQDWISIDLSETEYIFEEIEIGDHKITIKVQDSAGHISSESYSFTVDYKPTEPVVLYSMLFVMAGGFALSIALGVVFLKMTKAAKQREKMSGNLKKQE